MSTMQMTNVKETQLPYVIKQVSFDMMDSKCEKVRYYFDGKFVDNALVLMTVDYVTYNGTFNAKHELHGSNCKVYTDPALRYDFQYEGEFDHGRFKKGKLYSGKNGYYKFYPMYKYKICDKLEDCCITVDGEFDLDSGYLSKGKLIHHFKFGLEFNNGTYDDERVGYIKSKEGIFSLAIPYTLTEGKQILYNGVIMEGTFHGEQLIHGKVIYPSKHNTHILNGNFTNGAFDWNGKFNKNSHKDRQHKLIMPKADRCTII